MPKTSNRQPKDRNTGVRKKTFTGCWTCRARHLKCDEGKPSCLRCIKSRLSCEGYGVRLSWGNVACPENFWTSGMTGQHPDPVRGTRQIACTWINASTSSAPAPARPNSAPPPEHLSQEALLPTDDIAIELNDGDALMTSPSSVAPPYPVFLVDDSFTPAAFQPTSPLETTQTPVAHSAASLPHGSGVENSEMPVQQNESIVAERVLSATSPYEQRALASDVSDNADASQFRRPRSPQHASASSPTENHQQTHQFPRRALDPSPDLGIERQLIEYFVGHLSHVLMPIPIPSIPNYLNVVILPMALEGARLSRSNVSAASAVFHLVNSVSAFHLSSTANGEQRKVWSKVALSHHNLALSNLQKVILLNDPKQYLALLGSLLMCLIKETMTIGQPTWQVHVLGACHWVRRVDPLFWTESQTASFLYQFFAMIVALAKTQLVTNDEDDRNMAQAMFNFHHPSDLFCLDQAMGMPEAVMKAVNTINDIRHPPPLPSDPPASTGHPPSSTTPRPDMSPAFLDFFEMELFMSVPRPQNRCDILAMTDDPSTLIYHHSCIHYYACLLYFKRIVRNTPLADVQKYVSQSFDHLELVIKYTSRPCAPAIWPVALTLFEIADDALQSRACRTLDSLYDTTRFEIWPKLKTVARALWTARVDGSANPDEQWPEFLKNLEPMRTILF